MTESEPRNPDADRPAVDHERLLAQAMQSEAGVTPGLPPAPTPAEIAPRFPDFEVLGLIGRGGMGAVYKAVQRKLDRVVALKVLPETLAAEPGFEARFLREAKALASLSHPHVLTVYDFGQSDGLYFLATEYIDGVNLRQLMNMGALSPTEALRITPQICDALHYAHGRGVVHRDVKPENILIDTEGQVRIADFGLAKVLGVESAPELTRSTQVLGTPHYMAPEQWRGSASVDHRADIFALGVVLYEMLTGQLPMGHFDPPSARPGVPAGLDQVVQRTLAQQPERRYQSARELQQDVEQEAEELRRRPARRPRSAGHAARASGRAAGHAPLVGAVVLLVMIGLGFVATVLLAQRQMEARVSYLRAEAEIVQREKEELAALEQGRAVSIAVPVGAPATREELGPEPFGQQQVFAIGAALGGVAALFATLLGVLALRRMRATGDVRGVWFATLLAWAVPLTAAVGLASAPIVNLRDNDVQQVVTLLAIPCFGAAVIWFLLWQVRRTYARASDLAR